MKDKNPREKLIEAAISLLNEERDISHISIRKIAARAGVGIGLINYHFQNKENLIHVAVEVFISRVIDQWDDVVPRIPGASLQDQTAAMLKATAGFLARYPGLSRISILYDLNAEKPGDNTLKTLEGLLATTGNSPAHRMAALHALSRLQWFFIRHEAVRALTGFDFFDESSRNVFVDKIVHDMFRDLMEIS